jgi:putative MFS transporter
VDEARDMLERVAKMNGLDIGSLNGLHLQEESTETATLTRIPRRVILMCLRFMFLWFCVTFAYYGITIRLSKYLEMKHLKDMNVYINFMLMALSEFPGLAITLVLLNRFPRVGILIVALLGCFISTGVFALALAPWLAITSTCMLYFFVVSVWSVLYFYTPDSFPTRMRNTGFAFARVGAMIAGLIVGPFSGWMLDWGWSATEMIGFFGCTFLIAAIVSVEYPCLRVTEYEALTSDGNEDDLEDTIQETIP